MMGGKLKLLLGPRTPPVVLGPPPPGVFKLGTNLSGAENQYPQFPTFDEMTSAKNDLGLTTFRFPLCWSKANPQTSDGLTGVQHTVNGALDVGYLASINTVLGSAASLGMTALLDIHMFGSGPGGNVGSTAVPISAFADLWSKFATWCLGGSSGTNYPAAIRGLDLMNEWVNGTDSTLVFNASQAAITAIRATGFTKPIYVEGTNYTGAWNWVTGQQGDGSIGYNNTGLNALVDPLNNLIFSAHCYLDNDNSGGGGPYDPNGGFGYAKEVSKNGVLGAPPGTVVGPNIGVIRISAFAAWLRAHGLRGHIGEFGVSNDIPAAGSNTQDGQYDSASWNVAADNALAYCQANNIEVDYWGNGPGFGSSYSYFAGKTTADGKSKDFSAAGYQSSQAVILQKYSGWTGTQPTRYRLIAPLDSGFNPITRGVVGTASQPYRVIYNGKLTSSVTITPNDGGLGGTFSPPSVTLVPGNNALATFTYTPAMAAQIFIATTNSAGWADPPSLICATQSDSFIGISGNIRNVYSLRRLYAPYTGYAGRIGRPADAATKDVSYNARGDLPRQAMQDWASTRTPRLLGLYDNVNGDYFDLTKWVDKNGTTHAVTPPVLNLVNADGYPEIVWASSASACLAQFNSTSNGQSQQSILARIKDGGSGQPFIRQEWYSGPFSFGPAGYNIYGAAGTSASVSVGGVTGSYHSYAGTAQSSTTGGLRGYKDGSLVASTNTGAISFAPAFADAQTDMGFFKFSDANGDPGLFWNGEWQNLILHDTAFTPAQIAAFANDDATYYSTALPDTLSAVNPTISGTAPTAVVQGSYDSPFAAVTIADTNSGTPTDSVSIALTGGAGTLTGTGLSGSGPYTIAAASAASITSTLRALQWTPSGTGGSTTTFALTVTSSAGTSASDSATVVTVQAYQAETPLTPPSGTFTPKAAQYKGVNVSTNFDGPGSGSVYPQTSSGQYNWHAPFFADAQYYASKGMGLVRTPYASPRLFPVPYQLADPANRTDEAFNAYQTFPAGTQKYIKSLQQFVDYCFSIGVTVLFDPHNYGAVWNGSAMVATNGSATNTNILADNLSRIATLFKNYPNVMFSLNNEPASSSASSWHDQALQYVAAIRAAGANQKITISIGGTYDSAIHAVSTQGSLWDTFNQPGWTGNNGDPQNNFVFEYHAYLDSNNNGQTNNVKYTGFGNDILKDVVKFCKYKSDGTTLRTNPFKAFIGEFGAVDSNSAMVSEFDNMMNYMDANSDVFIGWTFYTGGILGYDSYGFGTIEPTGFPSPLSITQILTSTQISALTDRPLMSHLTTHL